MRFLADENIPQAAIEVLRSAGHEVEAISEVEPGLPDRAVLERAVSEGRVLLTFDRDFGALIYRAGLPVPPGVILLRFTPLSPEEPARLLLDLIRAPALSLEGRFTVLDRERARQRPLPGRAGEGES